MFTFQPVLRIRSLSGPSNTLVLGSIAVIVITMFVFDLLIGFDVFSINNAILGVDGNFVNVLINTFENDLYVEGYFLSYVLIFAFAIVVLGLLSSLLHKKADIRESVLIYTGYRMYFLTTGISILTLSFFSFMSTFSIIELYYSTFSSIVFALMFFNSIVSVLTFSFGLYNIWCFIFKTDNSVISKMPDNPSDDDIFKFYYRRLNSVINNKTSVLDVFESMHKDDKLPFHVENALYGAVFEHYKEKIVELNKNRYSKDFKHPASFDSFMTPVLTEKYVTEAFFAKCFEEEYFTLKQLMETESLNTSLYVENYFLTKGYNEERCFAIRCADISLTKKSTFLKAMLESDVNSEADKINLVEYLNEKMFKNTLNYVLKYRWLIASVVKFIKESENDDFKLKYEQIVKDFNNKSDLKFK